jgi:hypothetical protein
MYRTDAFGRENYEIAYDYQKKQGWTDYHQLYQSLSRVTLHQMPVSNEHGSIMTDIMMQQDNPEIRLTEKA